MTRVLRYLNGIIPIIKKSSIFTTVDDNTIMMTSQIFCIEHIDENNPLKINTYAFSYFIANKKNEKRVFIFSSELSYYTMEKEYARLKFILDSRPIPKKQQLNFIWAIQEQYNIKINTNGIL